MLLSHSHKFIFIKTLKTASTSIEVALSRFCDGPSDIITPIRPADEKVRQDMGLPGPKNYRFGKSIQRNIRHLLQGGMEFLNHTPAAMIMERIDKYTYNNYFTFAFERNPYDKYVSLYYYLTRDNPSAYGINDMIININEQLLSNWRLYAVKEDIAVDQVFQFDTIDDSLIQISQRLGLPTIELPKTQLKGDIRPKTAHYRELLSDQTKQQIDLYCAKEISMFGYRF